VSLPPSTSLHCPETASADHVSLSKMLAPKHTLLFSTHQSTQVRFKLEKKVCCCSEALNTNGSGLMGISAARLL